MRLNGILIDCARLIERHDYYFRLVDFAADWGLNTVVLHFSDDHGCSIELPGFEHLAAPHSFTADEIFDLINHAAGRGVQIIPELETFGHTRYLTDRQEYAHLFAGKKTKKLTFNSLDPLNPQTHDLMRSLIDSVISLFVSEYVHIGCDEVNLASYCRANGGLNEAVVWSDYVNRMIGMVQDRGKTPMMWADHIVANSEIARLLRKDVVAIYWNYEEEPNTEALDVLKSAGFSSVVASPSIACYRHRFLTPTSALVNTVGMAKALPSSSAYGFINTIWCPYRYVQGAIYYGIAFSSIAAAQSGEPDMDEFHSRFAREVFEMEPDSGIIELLSLLPTLAINNLMAAELIKRKPVLNSDQSAELLKINTAGRRVLQLAEFYQPRRNADIWYEMILAAECAWLSSERWMLTLDGVYTRSRAAAYTKLLRQVRKDMLDTWDKTRYPDDPQRHKPMFAIERDQHATVIMHSLPLKISPRRPTGRESEEETDD